MKISIVHILVVNAIVFFNFRLVKLEISGQSFGAYGINPHVISLNGKCDFDVTTNSIHVVEGGLVMAKVMENPFVEKEARLMYDGKSSVFINRPEF